MAYRFDNFSKVVKSFRWLTDLTTFRKLSNLSFQGLTDLTTFRKLSNLSFQGLTDLTTFRKLSNLFDGL